MLQIAIFVAMDQYWFSILVMVVKVVSGKKRESKRMGTTGLVSCVRIIVRMENTRDQKTIRPMVGVKGGLLLLEIALPCPVPCTMEPLLKF